MVFLSDCICDQPSFVIHYFVQSSKACKGKLGLMSLKSLFTQSPLEAQDDPHKAQANLDGVKDNQMP